MTEHLIAQLMSERAQLLRFVRSKVDNPDLAEDILQESLIKALRTTPALRDDEKLLPWFYRILNNAVIDAHRRRGAESKYVEKYAQEQVWVVEPQDEAVLCACFRQLLPTLKPEYASVIESMDLREGDPAQVAAALGITPNNLKVRRHRARQALRARLEETCRVCAEHGCLDCTCRSAQTQH